LQHSHNDEDGDVHLLAVSAISKDEAAVPGSAIGERLPYNDDTIVDWLHDLSEDSYRRHIFHLFKGIYNSLLAAADSAIG